MLHVPGVVDPLASIIIPTRHNTPLLLKCLQSLAAQAAIPFEVIVVANAPTSWNAAQLAAISGIRLLTTRVNLGFGGACRLGASIARGEFLVLLNDDTEVLEGWLAGLVDVATAAPGAGAVGSRVLFPDGQLQEAGSVVWRDGSTRPIGRGLDANTVAYETVRAVDYCSACSLLVRRNVWDAVGGLADDTYFPGYYEDVDLCFRIRRAGHAVLYSPASRLVHVEKQSSTPYFRDFLLARNRIAFVERWQDQLEHQIEARPEDPAFVNRAIWRARGEPPTALVIDDRYPDPVFGSGHGRMAQNLRQLVAQGYAVDLHVNEHEGDVNFTRLSVQRLHEPLDAHLSTAVPYTTVVISRPHNFSTHADTIRRHQPHARLVFDAEALFHRRLQQEAGFVPPDRVAAKTAEAECMRALEGGISQRADRIVCVTPAEAAFFARRGGDGSVVVASVCDPDIVPTTAGFAERRGAAFVAGWRAGADSPNGDGLRWFASEVLPLILQQVPDFELCVTGDAPPALAGIGSGVVRFTGALSDLRDLYSRIRVAIIPNRFGSGIKIKLVEAVQYDVPVVCTASAGDGLSGYGAPGVQVAETAQQFAGAVVALLTSAPVWEAARDSLRTSHPAPAMSWADAVTRAAPAPHLTPTAAPQLAAR